MNSSDTPQVMAMGYIGLLGDVGAWSALNRGVLGMAEVARDEGAVRFRVDERAWRVAVRAGDGGVEYIGYEVADRPGLDAIVDRLGAAGYEFVDDPDLAAVREVAGLALGVDPLGIPLEIFYGAKIDASDFVSPLGARFETGPLGLGHVALHLPFDQLGDARNFYLDGLGFSISDVLCLPVGVGCFLHCNRRHHTVALMGIEGLPAARVQHMMLQVDDLDRVGYAYDKVKKDGAAPLQLTLGRHANDRMVSFYCQTPSEVELEYGWGARTITDDWQITTYDYPSIWGHRFASQPG